MTLFKSMLLVSGLLVSVPTIPHSVIEADTAFAVVPAGGTIESRIFFKGAPPEPERMRITKDAQICGSSRVSKEFIVSAENKGLKNVVVLVQGVGEAPEAASVQIEQKGCVYLPHTQVTTRGATLMLINSDPTLHNVHGYLLGDNDSRRSMFNLAQPASMSTQRVLRRPGVYRIEYDVHPWMLSHVVVHDNQFHGISDENGHYRISGVPAGTHTVRIWHEGLGTVERSVTVAEGETVTLDLPIEPN